jgi:hypothetical protein
MLLPDGVGRRRTSRHTHLGDRHVANGDLPAHRGVPAPRMCPQPPVKRRALNLPHED